MSVQKSLDFYIRRAWLKIYNMYNLEAESRGYSISKAYVLLNIDPKEGTPSTQIGPLMGLQRASLSRTLKTMEDDGLIYRKIDPEDRRIRRIYLTATGEAHRGTAREVVLSFQARIHQQFPPEKIEVFLEVLNGITELAENQRKAFNRGEMLVDWSPD